METDGGRVYAAVRARSFQRQLALPGEHMTDLGPVDQVPALKQGHAGEVLEGTAHHVVPAIRLTDAGVRVEPGYNRIVVSHMYSFPRPPAAAYFPVCSEHILR